MGLGLWRPPIALFAHLSIVVYVSVAAACSGDDFDSKETYGDVRRRFFHVTAWGWERVPPSLVVGSRDVCAKESHRGKPS